MKEILGLIGLLFLQSSGVFQAIKLAKSKRVEGLSLAFLLTVETGLFVYVLYSLIDNDYFFVLSNLVGLTLNSIILCLYFKYRR